MDFAAWIEVYLGDRWYAFDFRNWQNLQEEGSSTSCNSRAK
jgi:transglutaminase-like putative cysteine protease